ncbi:MAG TPA: hypothetical protein VGW38_29470 [Chloroflexota bacterium]|nr:hypothetical protein [Chloroflexota bacterium]
MAVSRERVRGREEQQAELSRYRADMIAARLPIGRSLFYGAISGLIVFVVPVVVVLGSMLVVSVTYNFGAWPLQQVARLLRSFRPSDAAAPLNPSVPAARPTSVLVAPPIEGAMDAGTVVDWGAVTLVLFWPVIMLLIGAVTAAVYRARRRQRLADLEKTPLEISILPEVVLFYALTAGAGLLVGVGSFVAVGANVIFAWAAFLIWRWLFDLFAWHAAPAHVRTAASASVEREQAYQRRLREEG